MDSPDIVICRDIGQLIRDAGPEYAKTVIMRARLSDGGDNARFEFDYEDPKGVTSWFTAGGAVNAKLLDLLVAHRAYLVAQGQPPWRECEYSLNTDAGKFSMRLVYE